MVSNVDRHSEIRSYAKQSILHLFNTPQRRRTTAREVQKVTLLCTASSSNRQIAMSVCPVPPSFGKCQCPHNRSCCSKDSRKWRKFNARQQGGIHLHELLH